MDRSKNRYQKAPNKLRTWIRRTIFGGMLVFFMGFCLVLGTGLGLLYGFHDELPSLAPLEGYTSEEWNLPTKVYSRDGKLLAQFYEEKRELVPYEELPKVLTTSIVSVEDARFYHHNGVDFQGIVRAAIKNVMAGRIVEGGSTITQQLAKKLFFSSRQTFRRKIKEALLALKIERNYTKKEILERYLNKIYLGAGAYGVEAASQVYFGKSVRKLNIAEAALLAGLPKAPSANSPLKNPKQARERHRTILNLLETRNVIPEGSAQKIHRKFWKQYERKRHEFSRKKTNKQRGGTYFVEHVRKKLLNKYGADVVYQGGLDVRTTVDLDKQKMLQKKLYNYLLQYNIEQENLSDTADTIPRNNDVELVEGAVFLKNPQSGEVLAMVGGHEWHLDNQLNRATQAHRQPGSAFKPILYTAALDRGFTIGKRLQDRPLVFQTPQGNWVPKNYSKTYHGRVTLRTALINSLNVATVNLMEKIGPPTMIKYARKLGIQSPLTPHMSMALGGLGHGVNLKELVNVYSTFANKGIRTDAVFIREIRDREGNLLQRNFPFKREVISPQVSYLITYLLQHVVEEGTGEWYVGRHFERPIAGKTGTTNEFRDAWFMGYTPRYVMGSWFGYDESNKTLGEGMTGGRVAGRFWKRAAKEIFKGKRERTFAVPSGINFINIDPKTGYLATPQCPNTTRAPFRTGREPTKRCPVHTSPD
ncbi:MAG: penicillin-binding protein 1A, partial [bacterium]